LRWVWGREDWRNGGREDSRVERRSQSDIGRRGGRGCIRVNIEEFLRVLKSISLLRKRLR